MATHSTRSHKTPIQQKEKEDMYSCVLFEAYILPKHLKNSSDNQKMEVSQEVPKEEKAAEDEKEVNFEKEQKIEEKNKKIEQTASKKIVPNFYQLKQRKADYLSKLKEFIKKGSATFQQHKAIVATGHRPKWHPHQKAIMQAIILSNRSFWSQTTIPEFTQHATNYLYRAPKDIAAFIRSKEIYADLFQNIQASDVQEDTAEAKKDTEVKEETKTVLKEEDPPAQQAQGGEVGVEIEVGAVGEVGGIAKVSEVCGGVKLSQLNQLKDMLQKMQISSKKNREEANKYREEANKYREKANHFRQVSQAAELKIQDLERQIRQGPLKHSEGEQILKEQENQLAEGDHRLQMRLQQMRKERMNEQAKIKKHKKEVELKRQLQAESRMMRINQLDKAQIKVQEMFTKLSSSIFSGNRINISFSKTIQRTFSVIQGQRPKFKSADFTVPLNRELAQERKSFEALKSCQLQYSKEIDKFRERCQQRGGKLKEKIETIIPDEHAPEKESAIENEPALLREEEALQGEEKRPYYGF